MIKITIQLNEEFWKPHLFNKTLQEKDIVVWDFCLNWNIGASSTRVELMLSKFLTFLSATPSLHDKSIIYVIQFWKMGCNSFLIFSTWFDFYVASEIFSNIINIFYFYIYNFLILYRCKLSVLRESTVSREPRWDTAFPKIVIKSSFYSRMRALYPSINSW